MDLATPETTTGTDTAAEQSVLGAMMIDARIVPDVIAILQAEDFFHPKHAELYRILLDRFSRNEPTDPISIAAALADMPAGQHGNMLSHIGGAGYLHTLMASVTIVDSAPYHADLVRKRAVRRKIHTAGAMIAQLASTGTVEPDELADKAVHIIRTANAGGVQDDILMPSEAFNRMKKYIADLDRGVCVKTGFRDLDTMIGAGRAGHLIIVAGRPGSGKTVMACSIARNIAIRQGLGVLYITLEMSDEEMAMRTASAEASLLYAKLRDNRCTDAEWEHVGRVVNRLDKVPLVTVAKPQMSITQLNALIHRVNDQVPLGAVIIDYLQLMQTNSKLSNRQEQVAELSRDFKISAKQNELPFYVLAQLNRANESRSDKRPQLSDLRESGAVEQDADIVMMVHRPDYYDEYDRPGEADIMVVKNRHGQTGTVVVASQLAYMRFMDLAV